jgi:hypothetical protein
VLGTQLPKDVTDQILPIAVYSAPLVPSLQPKQAAGAAVPYANTYRSSATAASVPLFLKPNMTEGAWSQNLSGILVNFNPGEHGMLIVPSPVYAAFLDFFNQGLAKARSEASGFTIEPCPSPSEVCGQSFNAPHACQQVRIVTDDLFKLNRATMLLRSMYPNINATLQGGAVVEISTALDLKLCDGDTGTQGVAVCSYVQPAPDSEQGFGLGAPWFTGKFVQFDVSGPAPGFAESVGKVTWSDPINSCMF